MGKAKRTLKKTGGSGDLCKGQWSWERGALLTSLGGEVGLGGWDLREKEAERDGVDSGRQLPSLRRIFRG